VALAVDALASACKRVSLAVRRAALERLTGYAGSSTNVGGERQKKLDVLSNDLIKEGLGDSGRVAAFASEEEDGVVRLTEGAPLVVACDPLDGSSNVDASIPTGTIFGVYAALGQDDDARACLT
jgi:fructose-1,6-bisphosphatase I